VQLLALELLKVLLENSGPTFRSNERFTAGQLFSSDPSCHRPQHSQ
jgi:hypothetical protein